MSLKCCPSGGLGDFCPSLPGTTCCVRESPQPGWHWGLLSRHPALWSPGKQKQLAPPAFSIKDTASRNFSALVLGTLDYCDLTACVQLIQLKVQISKIVQVWCMVHLKLVWLMKKWISGYCSMSTWWKNPLSALISSTKPLKWYSGIWMNCWLAASSCSLLWNWL